MADAAVFNPCVTIPVYNHSQVLRATVADLVNQGLPVIMVDDGSAAECREIMAEIAADTVNIRLIHRPENGGKGAALKDGLYAARDLDFTHMLQIDADGQHDLGDVAGFLAIAKSATGALVCGYPVFDGSVPKYRFYGRFASHIWVWINTLSTDIKDSMCGFRVYPVAASCALLENYPMGNRMDFDGEFIVRWYWQGYPLQQVPTRVNYPKDGISHFHLWRDNLLISWMHARLFFGMLIRLPRLLAMANQKEPAS